MAGVKVSPTQIQPTPAMTNKALILAFTAFSLCQCAYQPSERYLTNADSGKVISERYYEIDGVRKLERRILVTATPSLETKVVTRILGATW